MIVFLKIVSTIALLLIAATMFARANDLRLREGWHWKLRLLGFVLSGSSSFGLIGYMWSGDYLAAFMYLTVFLVGITFVFVTTPYLPPWRKWIFRDGGEPVIYTDDRRRNQP